MDDEAEEEVAVCHLCPTTERDQGKKMLWVDWMQGSICDECAHYFGIGEG